MYVIGPEFSDGLTLFLSSLVKRYTSSMGTDPSSALTSNPDTAEDPGPLPATTETSSVALGAQEFSVSLWDWDGVLVDSRRNFYGAYEKALREQSIITSPREIFLREGEPTPVLLRAIFDSRHISVDDDKIRELVIRRREYDFALGERRLFTAVPRILRRLRDAGQRTGLVTGSSRSSLDKLLQPEQARWFDVIVTADDVTHGKPHPEPFLRAMQALKADPKTCVVIENAPFGIQAARAAGCAVIAICSTLSKEDLSEADRVVQDHEELETLLFGDARSRDRLTPLLGDSR